MTILSQLIGRGMANVIVSDFFLKKSDVIAPVPLFWWKRLRRGYNQANLLAAVVGDECGIEIKHMLRRVKNTRTQTQLNEESRRKNVSDAFEVNEVNSGLIKDKIVLLIDDVLTTGATVNECARVLKEAGAKKVYSCVAAIAPG
jgi:competence protein ComFC